MFLGLPAAALTYGWHSWRTGQRRFGLYSAGPAVTMLAAIVLAGAVFGQSPRLVNLGGLGQRASIITGFAWLTAVSARTLRRAPATATVFTLVLMSEPARDLPLGSPAVERAVELARRGRTITHLTVHGERVAAIVPESVIEALRAVEDAEDAAEADVAMDEPGESIPWEQVKAELDL